MASAGEGAKEFSTTVRLRPVDVMWGSTVVPHSLWGSKQQQLCSRVFTCQQMFVMLWFACRFISLPFNSFSLLCFGVAILANIPTHFSKGSKGREREKGRETETHRERDRERQRHRERERDRETETETERNTQRDRDRETDRQAETESQTDRQAGRRIDRQTDRQADGQTIKQRKRDRQRQGQWQRNLCRSCMSVERKCSLLKSPPTPC